VTCSLEKWPGEYPDSLVSLAKEFQFDSPQWPTRVGKPTAMLDFRRNDIMWVMVGCGLGGTSLVNANVSIRPDKRVFENFPKEILQDWSSMEQGFDLTKVCFLCFFSYKNRNG
jgi:cholesterol oxidase